MLSSPVGHESLRTPPMSWAPRRLLFGALVAATVGLFSAALIEVLAPAGFRLVAAIIVAAAAVKVTWVAINFWNAVIGAFVLGNGRVGLKGARAAQDDSISAQVAVAMTVCNE